MTLGAENPNPDTPQTIAAPSVGSRKTKNLEERIAKGEARPLVQVKSRKLARTRRGTLPPFLADEGLGQDCSVLPHRAASSAQPREILLAPLCHRPPGAAPARDYCALPQRQACGVRVPGRHSSRQLYRYSG